MQRENVKLSRIVDHHSDSQTDQLYEPLRRAVQGNDLSHTIGRMSATLYRSEMKRSQLQISDKQQHIIKQTTLIPQNMRLVQTNNPLKRIKARSRSYRAISVEEKVGTPLPPQIFQWNIATRPPRKTEIVYDYQPNCYQQKNQRESQSPRFSIGYTVPNRVRSCTMIDPIYNSFVPRVERVQSKTIKIDRGPIKQTSSTSITINNFQKTTQRPKKLSQTENQIRASNRETREEQIQEYYQECNKYSFNKDFKTLQNQGKIQNTERSRRKSSNYKYNLYSMMDEQANTKCSSGFCTKNEVIAPRIRNRW